MSVFLISFDRLKPNHDYQPLYDELRKMGAKQIQDSLWSIRTTDAVFVIFDNLWQHMHSERDRLLVVSFDKKQEYAARNLLSPMKEL